MNLNDIIENKQWIKKLYPFPHIIAKNVFSKSFYEKLEMAFDKIVTDFTKNGNNYYLKKIPNYGAYSASVNSNFDTAFQLFLTLDWHNLLANLFEIKATGNIDIALHHHEIGSRNGWIHNDLNPGWFPKKNIRDSYIQIPNADLCNYKTGAPSNNAGVCVENVRALAMIFYLNNTFKSSLNGGGTALYKFRDDDVAKPAVVYPPENNSILIFPCTPFSYHTFLCNREYPRNSIIMWLHVTKDDAVNKWGQKSIIKWE